MIMGSGAETVEETVLHLQPRGEKVGVLKVRLFRPFSVGHFVSAIPATVRAMAVLDRTKEPGTIAEPLYQDLVTAISESFAEERCLWRRFRGSLGGATGYLPRSSLRPWCPPSLKNSIRETAKPFHYRDCG